jgi:penicillin-binding protein 1A
MSTARFTLHRRKSSVVLLVLRVLAALVLWAPIPAALVVAHEVGTIVGAGECPRTLVVPVESVPSRVVTARGLVAGGVQRGQREWVQFNELSPAFIRAVVASEDATFFEHGGVDPRGVARAFVANRQAGRVVQGGSTITQQVAKSFVGDERTLQRKIDEVVVARMIERQFSKADIFEAYVNRLYWGSGAYGIGAAAELYFGIQPSALDEAQSAFLASMIPAPGRFRPFDDPASARVRRNRVLSRMIVAGLCDERVCSRARVSELALRPSRTDWVDDRSVERMALAELRSRVDSERDWRQGALRIETTLDMARQRRAQHSVLENVLALDRRQGLRERLGAGDPTSESLRQALAAFPEGSVLSPVVIDAMEDGQVSIFDGHQSRMLSSDAWNWAVPWREDARNHGQELRRAADAWAVGDVMLFDGEYLLQIPLPTGSFGSLDVLDAALETVVGGLGEPSDEFDRFRQGCRQPGSTFKPIVYSAALDRGFTLATMLRDAPVEYELGPQESWRPRNADSRFTGHIPLMQAITWSRNLPMLEVFRSVGYTDTVRRARALGLDSPLEDVESLALGASCAAPEEMLRVFGTFARGGYRPNPFLVDRVLDAQGRVVYRSQSVTRVGNSAGERTWRIWNQRETVEERTLSGSNAWLMGWLLERVVREGTGSENGGPGFVAAGKTGTTTAYDAWFAGYTARDVAIAWVGTDRNRRPLGRRESGGRLAMPMWANALFAPPEGLPLRAPMPDDELEMVGIDPESGLRAGQGRWSIEVPFRLGTAPTQQAASAADQQLFELDRVGREF